MTGKAKLSRVFFGLAIGLFLVQPSFANDPCKESVISSIEQLESKDSPPTNQASAQFLSDLKTLPPNLTQHEVQELKNLKILFIPGFLSGAQEKLGARLYGEQVAWLKSQGLESSVISYGLDYPEKIVEGIAARMSQDQPMLVVTHSKGSILMMQLMVAHPELQSRVRAWISVNGTLKGTPVADFAAGKLKHVLPKPMKSALEVQTEKFYREYMATHQASVDRMLERVPSLFVASWTRADMPEFSNSSLAVPSRLIEKSGYAWSDGMVPTENANIGCPDKCVILPQVGHFSQFNDHQFLRTLMHHALKLMDSP